MKRILCLLLALGLCLLMVPSVRAETEQVPQAVEQVRHSLVHLYGIGTDSETGRRSRWAGTGFAVGIAGEDSDIFLTNWHELCCASKFIELFKFLPAENITNKVKFSLFFERITNVKE